VVCLVIFHIKNVDILNIVDFSGGVEPAISQFKPELNGGLPGFLWVPGGKLNVSFVSI
jgi:hypothetical protein